MLEKNENEFLVAFNNLQKEQAKIAQEMKDKIDAIDSSSGAYFRKGNQCCNKILKGSANLVFKIDDVKNKIRKAIFL